MNLAFNKVLLIQEEIEALFHVTLTAIFLHNFFCNFKIFIADKLFEQIDLTRNSSLLL